MLEEADVFRGVEGLHGLLAERHGPDNLHLFMEAIPHDEPMRHPHTMGLHRMAGTIVDIADF